MLTVSEFAAKWGLADRTVRNYCAHGLIAGAILKGKTWLIPDDAKPPFLQHKNNKTDNILLDRLLEERNNSITGGIYHKTQIALAYNSNHIEGSTLTEEQTRMIFETRTLGETGKTRVDDIIEANNHFRCFDIILDNANEQLNESIIKKLHFILKTGTVDSTKSWFRVGEYKAVPNEVGGKTTCPPEKVQQEMTNLLNNYNTKNIKTFHDIVEFHYEFETLHPFQDGNGRVGRLIMFKECLANNIVPFIIEDVNKYYYYRGLNEWTNEQGYLLDTCLAAQDKYKSWLDYFRISYKNK